jgi:hypothetical protein
MIRHFGDCVIEPARSVEGRLVSVVGAMARDAFERALERAGAAAERPQSGFEHIGREAEQGTHKIFGN